MKIKITLRFHFTSFRMAVTKKTKPNVGKDVGDKEPKYTIGGNVNFAATVVVRTITYDSAAPLLGMHLKECKSAYPRDTCTPSLEQHC
jgi:hypothetical protein